MDFKIVNLKKTLEKKFNIKEDLRLFKEFEDRVYFYIERYEGYIFCFVYWKDSGEFELVSRIEHSEDTKNSLIVINHIGDNYIKFTSYNEEDTISLYSFEVSNNSLNILFRDKYQNIKLLDEKYAILSKDFIFGEDHYLLDIAQNEIYKINSIELENSFFYNTRVLDIKDEKYLVHTKYSLDTYDLDYHFDYSELKKGDSGVYIISYNEFINNIKNNEKVGFMIVMESSEFSYINAVNYDDLIHNIEHYKNYHFININNKNKEVELYRIIIDNKEIIKELETTVSYREYSNLDRIFAFDYPVTITKTSWLYACDEFRQFYPFEFIDRSIRDNNESVTDILDEYIIYYVWNELRDNSYYEYTRIRNRDDGSIYMDIYGTGKLLLDKKTYLVYNEKWLKTELAILEASDRYYTDLKDLFKSMDNKQLEYNWLVTGMVAYPQNEKFKDMVNKEYLWLTGEELTNMMEAENFQWIWGVFTAFDKNRSEYEAIEVLPLADGNKDIWAESPKLQHPLGLIEIIAWDSSLTIIISEEEGIVENFKKYYPEAIDLKYRNKLIDKQIERIEELLLGLEIIEEKKEGYNIIVSEIWNKLYRDDFTNPYINILDGEIINLGNEIKSKCMEVVPIRQVVIYFSENDETTDNKIIDNEFNDSRINYSYDVIRVWEMDKGPIINNKLYGLYSLLPLMKDDRMPTNSEEVLKEAVELTSQIEDKALGADILAAMSFIAEVKFSKDIISKFIRREMLMTSELWKEWAEEERKDGIKEGEKTAIERNVIKLLTMKFGSISKEKKNKISELDVVTLEIILADIFKYESLDEINKYLR